MVDYSKWDHIDISDDEGEDCHPNIDKQSWIKWKKEARVIKKKEDEDRKKKEDQQHQANLNRKRDLEDILARGAWKEEGEEEKARRELTEVAKEVAEFQRRRDEEKKHPVWDETTICKEGFSKTLINKQPDPLKLIHEPEQKKVPQQTQASVPAPVPEAVATPAAAPAVAPASEPVQELTEEEKKKLEEEKKKLEEEEEQKRVDEYVRQMEIKAHKFASSKTFDDYFENIKKNPDVICTETHQYLLLHASDFMKKGEDELSKHYLKGANIVNYCLELGKDGVSMFFARMRDPNPTWRLEFEKETVAYWHRIREKYIELGKVKVDPEKEKHKKPLKIEDDLD